MRLLSFSRSPHSFSRRLYDSINPSLHLLIRCLSAAMPDFMQASTSLILNFQRRPILASTTIVFLRVIHIVSFPLLRSCLHDSEFMFCHCTYPFKARFGDALSCCAYFCCAYRSAVRSSLLLLCLRVQILPEAIILRLGDLPAERENFIVLLPPFVFDRRFLISGA